MPYRITPHILSKKARSVSNGWGNRSKSQK